MQSEKKHLRERNCNANKHSGSKYSKQRIFVTRSKKDIANGYNIFPNYVENEFYTVLRSPHIARNEEALVKPMK